MKNDKSSGLGDLPTITISNNFPHVWNTDGDVAQVRAHFNDEQRSLWESGMKAFEDGKWDVANTHFIDVLEKSGGIDGPALYLQGKMKEYNFIAPKTWQGYWQK